MNLCVQDCKYSALGGGLVGRPLLLLGLTPDIRTETFHKSSCPNFLYPWGNSREKYSSGWRRGDLRKWGRKESATSKRIWAQSRKSLLLLDSATKKKQFAPKSFDGILQATVRSFLGLSGRTRGRRAESAREQDFWQTVHGGGWALEACVTMKGRGSLESCINRVKYRCIFYLKMHF